MVKTESFLFCFIEGIVVFASLIQQGVGTKNVGFDELSRPVDGTVYMGFCCKVHDNVWLVLFINTSNLFSITNIDLFKCITRRVTDFGKRLKVSCIGKFVYVDHFMVCVVDQVANDSRSDKSGTAGN